MEKPKYLYHGSRYKVDILEPRQASGLPEENGTEFGVYAYERQEMVIPFSLTITPFEDGKMGIQVDDATGIVTLSAGVWDETAIGYIYQLPSETFEMIDDLQWVSRQPVKPIACTAFYGREYADKVKLIGAALEYQLNKK